MLFDALNNETVPKAAIDKMHEIARGESCFSLPILFPLSFSVRSYPSSALLPWRVTSHHLAPQMHQADKKQSTPKTQTPPSTFMFNCWQPLLGIWLPGL